MQENLHTPPRKEGAIIAYRIITSTTGFPFERLRLYPVSAYYIEAHVPWHLVWEE